MNNEIKNYSSIMDAIADQDWSGAKFYHTVQVNGQTYRIFRNGRTEVLGQNVTKVPFQRKQR